MKLQILKLTKTAKLPEKAHLSDAGFDLFADEDIVVPPYGRELIKTGIAADIPCGYYGQIKSRSGLSSKKRVDTFAGVIDSGYRGEIAVILGNDGPNPYVVEQGDKISQIIIHKLPCFEVEEVKTLGNTERGTGGFGSTGNE